MAKPQTKKDLIFLGENQFEKIWKIIDSMSDEEQKAIFNFGGEVGKESHWKRDKNIRDVLIHLYEWHQLLLEWVKDNQKGGQKPFLPEPYNWKTYPEMNVEFWKKHQKTDYEKSKEMVKESHNKVIKLIETFSDKELFNRGHFNWTGGTTLGQYCISTTSSHYDWAMKKLKMHLKTCK